MNSQIERAHERSALQMKTDLQGTSLSHFRAPEKPEKVNTYSEQINTPYQTQSKSHTKGKDIEQHLHNS